jgi:hypothetical protein
MATRSAGVRRNQQPSLCFPPSLLFLLMTHGPAMLFLWAVAAGTPQWLRPALVFGELPMFYYLLHIPLLHLLAVIVCRARYGQVHGMFESPTVGQFPITPRMGILSADRLSGLGFRCGRALSALPLVCILEAAPQRCLAQLFLNSDDRLRDSPLKRVGADALVHPAA